MLPRLPWFLTGRGNMSFRKRKYYVDVEGQVDLIYKGLKVAEEVSKEIEIGRKMWCNPEVYKKQYEDRLRSAAETAQFLSSIEDLKEIQSNLDELRANFLMEKQASEALSDSTKSQHDDIEATFIKEKEALEAKYQKLFVVQYAKSLDDEFKAKINEATKVLEANFLKLCEPLYTKRCEVVNGVAHAECAINERNGSSSKNINIEGVPAFWLTVMKAHPVLLSEIKEKDEEVLKLLKDIKLCKIDNPKGFMLEFYFANNSFFKNQILTKTYELGHEDDVVPKNIIGTIIEWYPRKRLTQRVRVTERGHSDSFFNFFKPFPNDTAEELQTLRAFDYEIGCALANITHSAISRYLEVADPGVVPEVIESETESKYSGSEPDDEAYF